ncbi:MAG: hypothetical protein WB615_06735 [Candidatus Tumulicola sp.]
MTIPRPVHVKSRTRIGKEIIVDPTDSDEEYTAEMLSATNVLECPNSEERLDALRTPVRAAGIKRIARKSGVQRSKAQAFVNQGVSQHPSTIVKIEAALRSITS